MNYAKQHLKPYASKVLHPFKYRCFQTVFYLSLSFLLPVTLPVGAQTPSDAIMMPSGSACVLLNYDFGSFNEYWEGTKLRENQTIATVQRTTIMPMVAIGILDKLSAYVGVPYVRTESTEPNGGQMVGASGLQDLGIAVKYEALKKAILGGNLSLLASVGFSTPVSNYLSDYMPYSLGLGAPELSYRGIVQYKTGIGIYVRGAYSYLWRGYTEAERDYYYADGSKYSKWMDVPNAWSLDGALGVDLFNDKLKFELSYMSLKSLSGDDIRAYNAPQPTNKSNFSRVGVLAQYYFPDSFLKGFGILAYHNRVIDGLNGPKINNTGGGITYIFNYLKNKNQ